MAKYIDQIGEYQIVATNKDFIAKNLKGEYENHGHFKKLSTCYVIIRLVRRKTIPKKPYMIEAAKRITTDEKYKRDLINKQKKNKQRQHYFNPNKGVRR